MLLESAVNNVPLTAQGTNRSKSMHGSVGGEGIAKQRMPGADALMSAPRMYSPVPIYIPPGRLKTSANNRMQAERKAKRLAKEQAYIERRTVRGPVAVPAPRPKQCENCGDEFPSRNAWGRHFHNCYGGL